MALDVHARDPNNAMPVLLTLVLSLVGTLVARRMEPVILYPPPPLGFLQLQTRYRVNPDDPKGEMARRDDCWRFAQTWGLKIISIEELAEYAEKHGKDSIPGLKL
jgi:hypothetical protein